MERRLEHLTIDGMSCGHCVTAVREALQRIPGLEVLEVVIGHARIAYDPDLVDRAAIESAVAGAGYGVLPV
jgi:copper chaperone CopZ